MVAELDHDTIRLTEAARFVNRIVEQDSRWVWDIDGLYASVLEGLRVAGDIRSWGIDTWAVDYAVVCEGVEAGPVRAYRDPAHAAGMALVDSVLPWPEHYAITGIQRMPFNTIYQVAADEPQRLADASTLLMVPDLLSWRATGAMAVDVTNASSTAMVDPRTREWAPAILDALNLPESAFLAPDEPGRVRGETRAAGLTGLTLIGVATHDTASAFVGTPLVDRESALVLSLGTWALIGAETVGAVPSDAARELNVTHELGIDGTVRVLRNVCGTWLLEECRRSWGDNADMGSLLAAAAAAPAFAALLDIDDPGLTAPGQNEVSIASRLDRPWDGTRGSIVRALLESLVVRLMQRADEIETLLGTSRDTLHVVGGASRMEFVMQWLADATGKRVVAGPVEATAMGNAVVQWRTLGAVASVPEARSLIAQLPEIRTFEPVGSRDPWLAAAERLEG